MSIFAKKYREVIAPKLLKEFSIKNVHLIPKFNKIVVSAGFNSKTCDKKAIELIEKNISLLTGKKPVLSKARKSIASFKIREGQISGVFVTLRGNDMYEFLTRLVYVALPRIRDFKGFSSKSFDKSYNYSFGIKDCSIFEEVGRDIVCANMGINISMDIFSSSIKQSVALLNNFDFPIKCLHND